MNNLQSAKWTCYLFETFQNIYWDFTHYEFIEFTLRNSVSLGHVLEIRKNQIIITFIFSASQVSKQNNDLTCIKKIEYLRFSILTVEALKTLFFIALTLHTENKTQTSHFNSK